MGVALEYFLVSKVSVIPLMELWVLQHMTCFCNELKFRGSFVFRSSMDQAFKEFI
jgi:hypothetical protein